MPKDGDYIIGSSGETSFYGFIYKTSFNPANPFKNLLAENYGACGLSGQFRISVRLQAHMPYILVVTTLISGDYGRFSIFSFGPNKVSFLRFGKYLIVNNRSHIYLCF